MPRGDKPSFHKSDMFLERSPTGKGEVMNLASGGGKRQPEKNRDSLPNLICPSTPEDKEKWENRGKENSGKVNKK